MRLFKLDPRLGAIADMVPRGAVLYDIGTDHAHLPVHLIYNGIIDAAAACDIAAGPLAAARATAERFDVAESMRFFLCDGIPAEAEHDAGCIAVAGMGGETIAGILERAEWTAHSRIPLILQPMTKREALCEFLEGKYEITEQRRAIHGKREYTVLAVRGIL